jgi:hypothetical protein
MVLKYCSKNCLKSVVVRVVGKGWETNDGGKEGVRLEGKFDALRVPVLTTTKGHDWGM